MNFFAIIDYLREFNGISVCFRLLLATILSGIVGMERSKSGRAAGLRTHILVCLGATIAAMTGLHIHTFYGVSDISRIAAQVISGIGFLGAGTILIKNKSTVVGLTTAAGVWATGTIGIAIGFGFYEAAIVGTILIFLIIDCLNALDRVLRQNIKETSVYIEFVNAKNLNITLSKIKENDIGVAQIQLMKTKTNLIDGIAAEMVLQIKKTKDVDNTIEFLNNLENVNFAIVLSE